MAKVYLVMPDLSRPKLEALVLLSREVSGLGILVSYSTLKLKPKTLDRLRELRERADVSVVLDRFHRRTIVGRGVGVRWDPKHS
jgi:hypothetical protein